MEIAPMLKDDKDPTKPMNEQQKTIHVKCEEGKFIDDTKMIDFIDKNWAEYQKAHETSSNKKDS